MRVSAGVRLFRGIDSHVLKIALFFYYHGSSCISSAVGHAERMQGGMV